MVHVLAIYEVTIERKDFYCFFRMVTSLDCNSISPGVRHFLRPMVHVVRMLRRPPKSYWQVEAAHIFTVLMLTKTAIPN